MTQYSISGKKPQVAATAFVPREATLVGEVIVGERASFWFGAVARGDNEPIKVGDGSNVQEGAVLHADPGYPLTLGENVTVGHQAMLHGCTIGNGSLVGIQAVILNGAVIGAESLVGAGALVTERKEFPPRSMILGSPAKVVRQLSDEEVAGLKRVAENYAKRSATFKEELKALD
ncbi:gamma carbonic anhydrase family protein [Ramlibacter sp. G-1-2-2]|uniref:Gamma carbonic anhydrase family protein n=1 Tax=Ramlibacter agri TaxID=2728837 RepID=A0A848H110_9BURK|nr:gamma carbonic anhydrase family protein [Ramlibacter agri]NML43219.1 gamma carbonic anhydrase family protein [Ramlibacter agri]